MRSPRIYAADGETVVEEVRHPGTDVVLIDVSMPGIGGIEATRQIPQSHPRILVVALSAREEPGYRKAMLEAGASDHVDKRMVAGYLVAATRDFAGR
ncbi:response regulator [Singulisphaera sp. PoT]|uniref:response regulator n=1 Tax=Singulisphaera sp. PoT TaxID=3411797 RepID=UPI003BF5E065